MVDMEHFFDGFKRNPEFALRALEAAVVNGATHVVLCDTNGGSLPHEVEQIVGEVHRHVGSDVIIGIHCHDDTGCAVANSMAAVRAGARQVQGTLNGLGERTGNCNLTTVIPNLELKLGLRCLPEGRLERLTSVSHHVAEVLNRPLNPQAPYVGASAFAHKAGLHVSAIKRAKDAYEHVDPELVGNGTRFVVSEMAGRATIQIKAEELGLPLDGPAVNQVIDDLKRLEHEGYHFEAADASLELLMRRAAGWEQDFFRVESMRVITDEHTVNGVHHRGHGQGVGAGPPAIEQRHVHTAEGNGPVNAIDSALRAALARHLPAARPDPPHRLQGAHPRRRHGHRRGHPRADRRHRRQPDVDDDRRQRQHHRGLVAGARGEHRLRAPPRRRRVRDSQSAWPRRSSPRPRRSTTPAATSRRRSCPTAWMPGPPGGDHRLPAGGAAPRAPGPGPGLRASSWPRRSPTGSTSSPGSASTTPSAARLGIALRRASEFSRAPVIHDLTIAFTIWGFLDPAPPAELAGRLRTAASRVWPTWPTTTSRPARSSTRSPTTRCG